MTFQATAKNVKQKTPSKATAGFDVVLDDVTEIKEADCHTLPCLQTHSLCGAEQREVDSAHFSVSAALNRERCCREAANVFPFAEGDACAADSHFLSRAVWHVHHLLNGH